MRKYNLVIFLFGQKAVVNSILEYFNWTRVILVTTDDTYGNNAEDYISSLEGVRIFPIKISIQDTAFPTQVQERRVRTERLNLILLF
jgi:hypothetical protein